MKTTVKYWGGPHNRPEISLRVLIVRRNGHVFGELTKGQKERLDRHFCTDPGCNCGGPWGAEVYTGNLVEWVG